MGKKKGNELSSAQIESRKLLNDCLQLRTNKIKKPKKKLIVQHRVTDREDDSSQIPQRSTISMKEKSKLMKKLLDSESSSTVNECQPYEKNKLENKFLSNLKNIKNSSRREKLEEMREQKRSMEFIENSIYIRPRIN
ncbi:hypothetical protein SNEBB_010254 [Seison nebaliae]|nr:hypothetical protein SNEBB_010254 [Seison nebaliae]